MPAGYNKENSVGVILLAAGGSSRLGRPKQLLRYKDQTLLQYSLNEARASDVQSIIVVLGANADVVQKEMSGDKVHIVINTHWQEGMASSIRTGINAIIKINPAIAGIILLVCDQPFMNSTLLNNMIMIHQKTGKKIIACSYGNTFGPPVFFHQLFFSELLQLTGDIGARSIVQQHPDDVESISFPEGRFDIDTEADYEDFKKS